MSTDLRLAGLKKGKKFMADQKSAILREWEKSGNRVELAAKYQVHPQTLYRWKKCLDVGARELLRRTRRPITLRPF